MHFGWVEETGCETGQDKSAAARSWMEEDGKSVTGCSTPNYENADLNGEGGRSRPMTPAGMMTPAHIVSAYTPRSHPEGVHAGFFVGSC